MGASHDRWTNAVPPRYLTIRTKHATIFPHKGYPSMAINFPPPFLPPHRRIRRNPVHRHLSRQ